MKIERLITLNNANFKLLQVIKNKEKSFFRNKKSIQKREKQVLNIKVLRNKRFKFYA